MKRGGYGSRHFSWKGGHWHLFGDQSCHSIRLLPSVRVWWYVARWEPLDIRISGNEFQLTFDFLFWSITGEYHVKVY